MKQLFALILAVCLALPLSIASADTPVVVLQPQGLDVAEGASCMFTLGSPGAANVEWRFEDPYTGASLSVSQAEAQFPGFLVTGDGSDSITLLNVPLELDGWCVRCAVTGAGGVPEAAVAMIHVHYPVAGAGASPAVSPPVSAPSAQPLVGVPEGNSVRVVNAYVQLADKDGSPTGDRMEEAPLNGAINVVITAKGKNVHSWIFNGVKYDFEDVVTRIVIRNVTEPLLIEPVIDGDPQTLKPMDQILACRTGETVTVKSINARMNFMRDRKNSAGVSFTEFDFTSDYMNEAAGAVEQGGQITLKVTGRPPESYYKIYGWKFNDMRLTFNGEVKYFIVNTLDCSMVYEPLLQQVPAGTAWK